MSFTSLPSNCKGPCSERCAIHAFGATFKIFFTTACRKIHHISSSEHKLLEIFVDMV